MHKIIITDKGKDELNRFSFDMNQALGKILGYVPKADLIGLDQIYITDEPERFKKHLANSRGAYYAKENGAPSRIEVYLKRLFSRVNNPNSLNQMLPYQYIGISYLIYHEIGHHVETTKSHGIKKKQRENFSNSYADKLIDKYAIDNADAINLCLDNVEQDLIDQNQSTDMLQKIRDGWDKMYQEVVSRNKII